VSSDEELYQPLTRSERRFDPCDDEPERPPESWRGTRHEPVERDLGECRWFAVGIKRGRLATLAVEADSGDVVDRVDAQPAIRVLYVREDAKRAFTRDLDVIRQSSGWLPEYEAWAASTGEVIGYGGPSGDDRDLFARLLGDLYDVDVDDREVSLDG